MEGGTSPVEYLIISLHPDGPGLYHEDFHEEGCTVMLLCSVHHAEEVKIKAPINAEVVPAVLTEGASEEEMKCSLSFLSVVSKAHSCNCHPLVCTSFLGCSSRSVCP
jgi:hypothetical protein